MKAWKAVLFALFAAIVSSAVSDAKQVAEFGGTTGNFPMYPQTRQWTVAHVAGEFGFREMRVQAIDTAGVCLYLSQQAYSDTAPLLVAVPKTQLPKGAGCQ